MIGEEPQVRRVGSGETVVLSHVLGRHHQGGERPREREPSSEKQCPHPL